MSRQELADAANQCMFDMAPDHLQRGGIDANYIGKLERGVHRWPIDLHRAALRQALRVNRDAELGFYVARRDRHFDDPQRQLYVGRRHRDDAHDVVAPVVALSSGQGSIPHRADAPQTTTAGTFNHDGHVSQLGPLAPPGAPAVLEPVSPARAEQSGRPIVAYVPFQPAALDRPALDWLCDERPRPAAIAAGGRRVDPAEVELAARPPSRRAA